MVQLYKYDAYFQLILNIELCLADHIITNLLRTGQNTFMENFNLLTTTLLAISFLLITDFVPSIQV